MGSDLRAIVEVDSDIHGISDKHPRRWSYVAQAEIGRDQTLQELLGAPRGLPPGASEPALEGSESDASWLSVDELARVVEAYLAIPMVVDPDHTGQNARTAELQYHGPRATLGGVLALARALVPVYPEVRVVFAVIV